MTSVDERAGRFFVNPPALRPITRRFEDHSTPKVFAFSFYCDRCGREWCSTPRAFCPGELASPVNIRVYRMLWSGARRAAYEQANLEAILNFSLCPVCGRRVCVDCFHESGTDASEICRDCQPE